MGHIFTILSEFFLDSLLFRITPNFLLSSWNMVGFCRILWDLSRIVADSRRWIQNLWNSPGYSFKFFGIFLIFFRFFGFYAFFAFFRFFVFFLSFYSFFFFGFLVFRIRSYSLGFFRIPRLLLDSSGISTILPKFGWIFSRILSDFFGFFRTLPDYLRIASNSIILLLFGRIILSHFFGFCWIF